MKAETTFSLKDQLFNGEKVEVLARLLETAYPEFPHAAFHHAVMEALPSLELKERIAHITATLRDLLPEDYTAALRILLDALPEELDANASDQDYGDFIFAPLSLFVARYGCTPAHLHRSLQALREMTKRFSAEDAVRYFLNTFPAETLDFLQDCARDEHYHVRRLASESTRPLLPWAQRLTIHYRAPLPILDLLFADPTRYVTRSVANHLNDVSKLDAELVIATLRRWRERGQQETSELQFMTKHALRTLVKRGHPAALELMGFAGDVDVEVLELATSTPLVRLGQSFQFTVALRSGGRQDLLIDYVMTFAGDGRGARRKVFKLKHLTLDAGESVSLAKSHPMRLMTTRHLHGGEHHITLQVNGRAYGTLSFDLLTP